LRPASAEDAEFFFALHKRSFTVYVDQIWGWDDDVQRAYLTEHLVLDRVRVIVVDGANDRARRLYRRLGFTEVSRDGVAPEVRIRMVAEPSRVG
jgi:hypothetical protein